MKHIFVINPSAGDGEAEREFLPAIIQAANAAGILYEIHITSGSMDAERFSREKCLEDGPVRLYACGGDGTLNEVANGIYGHDNAELAVIPAGTGNDFVKTFKNSHYFTDLDRQIKGKPVIIDLLKYNGRFGVNVCNAGFDSAVANRIEKLKRYPLLHGKTSYIAGIFLEFFKKMGNCLEVTIDDSETYTGNFLLFAAGIGSYYGGGFHALPLASRSRGEMDLCLVRKFGRLKFLSMISDYKAGRHVEKLKFKELVIYRKCRKVTVKSEKPFLFSADGETNLKKEVCIEVVPRAIRLSLPEGCEMGLENE